MSTRSPARQPERTRLSWQRTALAGTAVTLLVIRLALHGPPTPGRVLAVAFASAGWLAMLAVGWRRIRALATARPAPPGWSVPATALVMSGLAGLGVALVAARIG